MEVQPWAPREREGLWSEVKVEGHGVPYLAERLLGKLGGPPELGGRLVKQLWGPREQPVERPVGRLPGQLWTKTQIG